jgi:hypothetical protein
MEPDRLNVCVCVRVCVSAEPDRVSSATPTQRSAVSTMLTCTADRSLLSPKREPA